MTPERYQPKQRLIDNPNELRRLYNEENMTTYEIAEQKASVGQTTVAKKLREYGIKNEDEPSTDSGACHDNRGTDPPSSFNVDWSKLA